MQLIGMLDSPYVRRVAISLRLQDIPFEHRSISVFRGYAEFQGINPVVKAPTLVCDDGTVLMDSSLILQLMEGEAARSLIPADRQARQNAFRILGLALVACEKSVQILYEKELRPADKQHGPWLDRVHGQLEVACRELEAGLAATPLDATEAGIDQAGITSAVAWSFTQLVQPGTITADAHPTLAEFAARAEALPVFQAFPMVN
jgi:glutathione S-transferase